MIVPAVTEKWHPQSRQFHLERCEISDTSVEPHRRQTTPSGQRRSSRSSRHLSSVLKWSTRFSMLTGIIQPSHKVQDMARKNRRRLPKDIATRPDSEVAEKLFGNRVKRELDEIRGSHGAVLRAVDDALVQMSNCVKEIMTNRIDSRESKGSFAWLFQENNKLLVGLRSSLMRGSKRRFHGRTDL